MATYTLATVDYTDDELALRTTARGKVMQLEGAMRESIASGENEDALDACTLNHYFAPKSDEYGCYTYAREMFIPKDVVIVGKIHRHSHINIISKGRVAVATEYGTVEYVAPCTFISEVGLKRAVVALEDTIWTTIHLTDKGAEEDLAEIEDEVIAKTYAEIGLEEPEYEPQLDFNVVSALQGDSE